MPDPIITAWQRGILFDILAPYADKIERVGVFGSRAIGAARPNSDIDLILYGTLSEMETDQIRTHFIESSLEVPVDVATYHLVSYPPFRDHIDAVAVTLFTHNDLKKVHS